MRELLVGIQVVGGGLALLGVYCMAAMPLSDYHWYNRIAVLVLMGPMLCWAAILGVVAAVRAVPFDELLGIALFTLIFGVPILLILRSSLNVMALKVMLGEGRTMNQGLRFMPIGLVVQLVPSAVIIILLLVGIQV